MKHFLLGKLVSVSVILAAGVIILIQAKVPASTGKIDRQDVNSKPKTLTTIIAQVDTSSVERDIFDRINQYRQNSNLPALAWNDTISNQARIHSQNMANGTVPFSHNGFPERVQAIAKVIPYKGAAENVAYNRGYSNPAANAVQGWLNSSGHLLNIKGNYNLTGVGVARNAKGEYYFTQIFILKR